MCPAEQVRFPAAQLIWEQEEPANQGGDPFVHETQQREEVATALR